MDLLRRFVDIFLHLDTHLSQVIAQYGTWTYLILFLIVFCETGLVVTPFLPGDSLLFAAGTFAALGALDLWLVIVLLIVAAIVGDTVNYWVGAYIGPRAFSGDIRFLRKEYLERTQAFYERHGGKTIILARFVPDHPDLRSVRRGRRGDELPRFITYNVVGAVLWVGLFVLGGYFFGNIPVVRENFTLVILAIIAISVMPIVVEALRARTTAGMTSRFLVSGMVQGVGFRWFVARHARSLGLTGYARNLPDGRVEVVAAGADPSRCSSAGALLRAGPAHAQVERVERARPGVDPQHCRRGASTSDD